MEGYIKVQDKSIWRSAYGPRYANLTESCELGSPGGNRELLLPKLKYYTRQRTEMFKITEYIKLLIRWNYFPDTVTDKTVMCFLNTFPHHEATTC
jgi:hypothetical protein